MRKPFGRGAALTGVVVSGVLAAALLGTSACATDDQTPVTLTIRKGSSFREAADSLAAHGVVRSGRLFGFYAARRGSDRTIRYGTYLIRRGASWNEVLTALQWGRGIVHRVTIREGLPIWEIVPLLSTGLALPTDALEAAVRDSALLTRVGAPRGIETLEGYLFPDTYDFPDGTTARQAVDVMVRRFEKVWKPEWTTRLADVKMTRHQIVTLASIVEMEVRKGDERPVVAAVYTNRLKARMMLQADPTVQYAMKVRPGRVLLSHLKVDSPYNTYRRYGLPPGPISSPGAASIEASLFPAQVPYRFFVAHPDGHHEFRTTYREHLIAIEFVRKVARESAATQRETERARALDSAVTAVGAPRAAFDSLAAKRPNEDLPRHPER